MAGHKPPLFGDLDDVPDELVVHISTEDLSDRLADRLGDLAERLDLSPEELKIASAVGLEDAIALRQQVEAFARKGADIFWSGYPRYNEIEAVCEVICSVRQASSFGVFTSRQLAFFLNELRRSRPIVDFFRWYSSSYKGQDRSQDNIFRFLRACEYGLPQMFAVVEMFAKRKNPHVDYRLFLAEMPRWFRAEVLKNLDEQGIPIQIAERFFTDSDTVLGLSLRIRDAAVLGDPRLTDFEVEWMLSAIPQV